MGDHQRRNGSGHQAEQTPKSLAEMASRLEQLSDMLDALEGPLEGKIRYLPVRTACDDGADTAHCSTPVLGSSHASAATTPPHM